MDTASELNQIPASQADRISTPLADAGGGICDAVGEGEMPTIIHASGPSLNSMHAEFVQFHEGYIRHYIALADTKAAFIFGVSATFLAYFFSRSDVAALIHSPFFTSQHLILLVVVLFLGLAIFCSVWVVMPRTTYSGEGLVNFGAVAAYKDGNSYLDRVSRCSESELIAARVRHAYDVSVICFRKYEALRKSFWFGILGLFSSLPFLST
jgi:hypothetical protein